MRWSRAYKSRRALFIMIIFIFIITIIIIISRAVEAKQLAKGKDLGPDGVQEALKGHVFRGSEVMRLLNECQQWSWTKSLKKSESILNAQVRRWIEEDGLKLGQTAL